MLVVRLEMFFFLFYWLKNVVRKQFLIENSFTRYTKSTKQRKKKYYCGKGLKTSAPIYIYTYILKTFFFGKGEGEVKEISTLGW